MFGVFFLSDFFSPIFWFVAGAGAYFLILAIAEKRGKEIGPTGIISGIGLSIGMFVYCLKLFY